MLITVPSTVVPNWVSGSSPKLRIYLTRTIVVSTGETRVKSTDTSFYRDVTCSVVGTDLTIPQITLDSTTDSSDTEAKYVCWLYNGNSRIELYADIRVPHVMGSTVTWGTLINFNSTSPPFRLDNTYTKAQTEIAIQEAIADLGGGAVNSVFGRTGIVIAASGDYNAGQITNTPAGSIAAITVQDAINELDTEKSAVGHTHTAASITNVPAGGISSLDVQAAINELDTTLQAHVADTANPHAVTKAQVGLSNVDNTSDLSKPISTATQTALNLKADDSAVVHKTGDETVAGIKTFTSSPVVPAPSTDLQASTKKYVDDTVAAAGVTQQNVQVTTASIADGATENGSVVMAKGFMLKRIVADRYCRVRLYKTSALRTTDAARTFGDRSYRGTLHGIISDIKLTSGTGLDWYMSPEALGANGDSPISTTIYYAIENNSGATSTVQVIFTFVRLEV